MFIYSRPEMNLNPAAFFSPHLNKNTWLGWRISFFLFCFVFLINYSQTLAYGKMMLDVRAVLISVTGFVYLNSFQHYLPPSSSVEKRGPYIYILAISLNLTGFTDTLIQLN